MKSLLFIMPAYKRYALSTITFKQRAWLCEQLSSPNFHAEVLVLADDDNLDIAEDNGFIIKEVDNSSLGKRFNDGHEWAADQGFDYVSPVGSDMFIAPSVYANLNGSFIATTQYTAIKKTGKRRADMLIPWGVLQIIPVSMMKDVDYRPCDDTLRTGCDTSTRINIGAPVTRRLGQTLECVSFQSKENQITKFTGLARKTNALISVGTPTELLEPLRPIYPLVDDLVDYYASGQSLTKGTNA